MTLLINLFAYNDWAWQRVFPSLAALSPTEYMAERPFFWGSLHGLTVHCFGAEWIWYQRCQGESPPALPRPDEFADLNAVRARWDPLRADWQRYVASLSIEQMAAAIRYQDQHGNRYTVALSDLLQHVMNHATEHRGQMTPILYQLGHPTEPLDYHMFRRTPID